MIRVLREIRIFLASPFDVNDERKVVGDIIAELNRTISPDLGIVIHLIRWEDMVPGMGRSTQQVILDQADIASSDVFIEVLWNRFGTQTGQAASGTEVEFNIAYKACNQHGLPRIMLYFCNRPSSLRKDELEQKQRVLAFRDKIKGQALFKEYESIEEFRSTLREDLTKYLLSLQITSQNNNRVSYTDTDFQQFARKELTEPAEATLLYSDSRTDLSSMNATFTSPGVFGVAQAVKFTPPNPGWKLEVIIVVGTDGWKSSNKANPVQGIFGLEIRDANLKLLYQYADTQLEHFTSPTGYRAAKIEVPAIPMNGDFYVCFYGRDIVKILTELQNATGNSYYYLRDTGQLLQGGIQLKDNTTLPVNWIIRAVGE
jgi:hypothetical protein